MDVEPKKTNKIDRKMWDKARKKEKRLTSKEVSSGDRSRNEFAVQNGSYGSSFTKANVFCSGWKQRSWGLRRRRRRRIRGGGGGGGGMACYSSSGSGDRSEP